MDLVEKPKVFNVAVRFERPYFSFLPFLPITRDEFALYTVEAEDECEARAAVDCRLELIRRIAGERMVVHVEATWENY